VYVGLYNINRRS